MCSSDLAALADAVAAVAADRHRSLLGIAGRSRALTRDWRTAVDELIDLLAPAPTPAPNQAPDQVSAAVDAADAA